MVVSQNVGTIRDPSMLEYRTIPDMRTSPAVSKALGDTYTPAPEPSTLNIREGVTNVAKKQLLQPIEAVLAARSQVGDPWGVQGYIGLEGDHRCSSSGLLKPDLRDFNRVLGLELRTLRDR